jgi:hypothetical protein
MLKLKGRVSELINKLYGLRKGIIGEFRIKRILSMFFISKDEDILERIYIY